LKSLHQGEIIKFSRQDAKKDYEDAKKDYENLAPLRLCVRLILVNHDMHNYFDVTLYLNHADLFLKPNL
jgi:hypothetical protein